MTDQKDSVALLKAKIKEHQAECVKLREEKKMLAHTVSALQNEIFQRHADADAVWRRFDQMCKTPPMKD
jgi:cell division protein FtsB